MVQWHIIQRNRYGHRFIEEPDERVAYREKCKHRDRFGGCALNYYCHEMNGKHLCFLAGCTPNVMCPRLARWDKRNGIQQPYTIVQNSKDAARDAAIKAEMDGGLWNQQSLRRTDNANDLQTAVGDNRRADD